ncbi:MAG: dTDP-glucose 4,6-dehydratase, partial [Planctomycetota bacterium]
CDRDAMDAAIADHGVDLVINFAAESHVDRSIQDSTPFVKTNVVGTQVLLDAAKAAGVARYVQVSTDEVYGTLGETGLFTESTPLAPNSPYSSSKAGADLLVRAYHETFGMDTVTTRCSNNYGPFQFPEKLIPLFVSNALDGKSLPVYGDGKNVRDWIYVDDHARGIWAAATTGKSGEVYNFGGESELQNIVLTKHILKALGKSDDLITFVKDRPGHDLRYAIDCSKAKAELGWEPNVTFEEGLQRTIDWYLANPEWIERVKSGAYREYYVVQYGE